MSGRFGQVDFGFSHGEKFSVFILHMVYCMSLNGSVFDGVGVFLDGVGFNPNDRESSGGWSVSTDHAWHVWIKGQVGSRWRFMNHSWTYELIHDDHIKMRGMCGSQIWKGSLREQDVAPLSIIAQVWRLVPKNRKEERFPNRYGAGLCKPHSSWEVINCPLEVCFSWYGLFLSVS